jgi:hypothetical protein
MVFRKYVIALSIAAALGASLGPSQAAFFPPSAPPPSTAPGVIGWSAGGIIVTAGVLCLYDLWLKINGAKNWDGTAKKVVVHHKAH